MVPAPSQTQAYPAFVATSGLDAACLEQLELDVDLTMSRRGMPGVVAYPLLTLAFALATPLGSRLPLFSLLITAASILAGAARFRVLTNRPDTRSTRARRAAWRRAAGAAAFASAALWGADVGVAIYVLGIGLTTQGMLLALSGIAVGLTYSYSPRTAFMRRLIVVVLGPTFCAALAVHAPGVAALLFAFGAYLLILGRHLGVEHWQSVVGFAQLRIGRDALRLVLDNVEQGLLTLDHGGRVATERSATLERWFGSCEPDMRFVDYLRPLDPAMADFFEVMWDVLIDSLREPELLDLMVQQLPTRLSVGARTFDLSYRPIVQDGVAGNAFVRMLVVISDVTSLIAKERVERLQREQVEIFDRIMRDRVGVDELRLEASRTVALICAVPPLPLSVFQRTVHTLKGNAATFGLGSLAEICQRIETEAGELLAVPPAACLAELDARWREVEAMLAGFLDRDTSTRVDVQRDDVQELLAAVRRGAPQDVLAATIEAWELEPMTRRLHRIAGQVRHLARILGKGEVRVVEEPNGVRLDAKAWSAFWSALVHVTRNAVDHGLEKPQERVASGKLEPPTISLRTRNIGNELVIELEDDGRGVRWDLIAAKARGLGLAAETHDDLVAALFSDGLTTCEAVSETSGRGIGTGAVRVACEALDGRVEVISESGRGTVFRFRFPRRVLDARVVPLPGSEDQNWPGLMYG